MLVSNQNVPGDLHFNGPISRWDEALPLGNGFCGALIWGPSQALRFSLDRGDLWDCTPCPAIHSPDYTYQNMVKLARAGEEEKIREIFDAPYNHPTPSKLPAGKLILHLGEDPSQYSSLCLSAAQAEIHAGAHTVLAFIHAKKHLGMIKIPALQFPVSVELQNPSFGLEGEEEEKGPTDSVAAADLKALKYPAPVIGNGWFTQKISGNMEYGVFTRTVSRDGGMEIAWCIAASTDGPGWKEDAWAMLDEALRKGYDREFSDHREWWAHYWETSSLQVPNEDLTRMWYLSQYFFGCCSRKGCCPMPLQGVFTADEGRLPPWKGDYHHDLNTELCYCSFDKAGRFPEGECFLDYLLRMRDCGRKFARDFYGAPGLCLPGTMTQNGDSLGGWGMYSLSPTNQIWLCQSFYRHFRTTGDLDFLREQAYPYLLETADCILHLLEEGEDGTLRLPISSSPEIHDDTIRSFLTPNSNYDLSLMLWLFSALSELSRILGDGKEVFFSETLRKLPSLAVSKDQVLMLSPDEILQESHRHFSHAMAIYPLCLLPYQGENRKIIDATIRQLEELGTENWVGYTFCWMANLYAVQGNGEQACRMLTDFFRGFCSPNGFHLNGDYQNLGLSSFHYRPFTLEANFFAADALQEMLLKTREDQIALFPALPRSWQQASFRNFRGDLGLKVSAEMKDGRLFFLKLEAPTDRTLSILNTRCLPELLKCSQRETWISLSLKAGIPRIFCLDDSGL